MEPCRSQSSLFAGICREMQRRRMLQDLKGTFILLRSSSIRQKGCTGVAGHQESPSFYLPCCMHGNPSSVMDLALLPLSCFWARYRPNLQRWKEQSCKARLCPQRNPSHLLSVPGGLCVWHCGALLISHPQQQRGAPLPGQQTQQETTSCSMQAAKLICCLGRRIWSTAPTDTGQAQIP